MLEVLFALLTTLSGMATVTDGDTIRINDERIRIWALDAPEIYTDAGKAAKTEMENLTAGKIITCKSKGYNSYNRTVAQCFVGGQDLTQLMIDSGTAKAFCKFADGNYGCK